MSSTSTGHITSTFQNYRLEHKLTQSLGEKIDIITSNVVQSKISYFIKLIWEQRHQLYNCICTTACQLEQNKTDTEFLIVPSCHRLPHKD